MIGEDYKVTADRLNITLWERVKKSDKFRVLCYCGEYADILEYLAKYEIHGLGLAELEKVASKQEEIYKMIKDTIESKVLLEVKE